MSTWVIVGSLIYGAYNMKYRLSPMDADPIYTTVSGFAAGAYMADQLQIIYSETFHGAGMIGGGPYSILHYANVTELDIFITNDAKLNFTTLASHTQGIAERNFGLGLIDDTANLEDVPIFILSETVNPMAPVTLQRTQELFYENVGANIYYEEQPFDHTFPIASDTYKKGFCDDGERSIVTNCAYDWAGKVLDYLIPNVTGSNVTAINPKNEEEPDKWEKKGVLRKFNQKEFLDWSDRLNPLVYTGGLDNYGYVYYPNKCGFNGGCKIHVVLHGCRQNVELVGFDFILNSGFAEYAYENDLIILFPQANGHWRKNSFVCWDFGMTGGSEKDYATNQAYQPKALKRMVERISSSSATSAMGLGESQFFQFLNQVGNTLFTVNNIINRSDLSMKWWSRWRSFRNIDYYVLMYPWVFTKAYGGVAIRWTGDKIENTVDWSQNAFYGTWSWMEQNPWIWWIKE